MALRLRAIARLLILNFRKPSMMKHTIIAILTFSMLLVWNLDFAYGLVGTSLLSLSYLVILLLLASLLLASICRKKIKALLILLMYLAAVLLSLPASTALESFKTQNTEKRGQTIISAIEKYRKARGKYPESLSELVPNYLDDVPKPDIGLLISQSFGYEVDRDRDTYNLYFVRPTSVIGSYSPKDGTWYYD